MAEIWNAYDRQFHKIVNIKLIRGEPIPTGMYHLVSEIIVRHTDGTYLLMQRDWNKHLGGMWELTAGGSALAGETPLMCAIRELREETGIAASDMTEIRRIAHDAHQSLYAEYLCITACDKASVILQDGETIAYKWVNRETLMHMTPDVLASSRAFTLVKELHL